MAFVRLTVDAALCALTVWGFLATVEALTTRTRSIALRLCLDNRPAYSRESLLGESGMCIHATRRLCHRQSQQPGGSVGIEFSYEDDEQASNVAASNVSVGSLSASSESASNSSGYLVCSSESRCADSPARASLAQPPVEPRTGSAVHLTALRLNLPRGLIASLAKQVPDATSHPTVLIPKRSREYPNACCDNPRETNAHSNEDHQLYFCSGACGQVFHTFFSRVYYKYDYGMDMSDDTCYWQQVPDEASESRAEHSHPPPPASTTAEQTRNTTSAPSSSTSAAGEQMREAAEAPLSKVKKRTSKQRHRDGERVKSLAAFRSGRSGGCGCRTRASTRNGRGRYGGRGVGAGAHPWCGGETAGADQHRCPPPKLTCGHGWALRSPGNITNQTRT